MSNFIDLRSDTMTRPTPQMRQAMADSEVGDDYYRDDPTVARLEAMSAERLGKEAGLLVLSGTMGNLVAMLSLARNGESILVEERSHVYVNEAGNIAGICSLTPRLFSAPDGIAKPGVIDAAVFPDYPLHPVSSLLCLENTHNAAGGLCITAVETKRIVEEARRNNLSIHIDGARLFNASVATGDDVADLSRYADTVTFCLTKGLGAPVGSMLCGPKDLIHKARRFRHSVGGGMRQAGVFAAAGIVALEKGPDLLADDHRKTRLLASGLAKLGLNADQLRVETNILFVHVPDALIHPAELVSALRAEGILLNAPKGNRLRFVQHRDVSFEQTEAVIKTIGQILGR